VPQISEMSSLSKASTAWASAKLACLDGPFLSALAKSSVTELCGEGTFDDGIAGMALWAFSQMEDLSPAWRLVEHATQASSITLGALLGTCERRGLLTES